jgi:general stress protein CsbA
MSMSNLPEKQEYRNKKILYFFCVSGVYIMIALSMFIVFAFLTSAFTVHPYVSLIFHAGMLAGAAYITLKLFNKKEIDDRFV